MLLELYRPHQKVEMSQLALTALEMEGGRMGKGFGEREGAV